MVGGEKLSFVMGDQGGRKQSVTSAPGENSGSFVKLEKKEKRPSMRKPRISTLQDIAEEPYTTPVPDTPE